MNEVKNTRTNKDLISLFKSSDHISIFFYSTAILDRSLQLNPTMGKIHSL